MKQVWPGATHFPDFLSQAGADYWAEQLQDFHKLAEYDGLWIDMNEASNFCTGEICKMPSSGAAPHLCICTMCQVARMLHTKCRHACSWLNVSHVQ